LAENGLFCFVVVDFAAHATSKGSTFCVVDDQALPFWWKLRCSTSVDLLYCRGNPASSPLSMEWLRTWCCTLGGGCGTPFVTDPWGTVKGFVEVCGGQLGAHGFVCGGCDNDAGCFVKAEIINVH